MEFKKFSCGNISYGATTRKTNSNNLTAKRIEYPLEVTNVNFED
jgi:hypothetical protein